MLFSCLHRAPGHHIHHQVVDIQSLYGNAKYMRQQNADEELTNNPSRKTMVTTFCQFGCSYCYVPRFESIIDAYMKVLTCFIFAIVVYIILDCSLYYQKELDNYPRLTNGVEERIANFTTNTGEKQVLVTMS